MASRAAVLNPWVVTPLEPHIRYPASDIYITIRNSSKLTVVKQHE